jgi:hypothetical protein
LREVFAFTAVPPLHWLAAAACGAATLPLFEAAKFATTRRL